jgi:4-amino-4-deoxy-L-arabinose transferase-like glycosyltransferase
MKRSTILIVLLVIIITLLKLSALDTALYDDEAQWASFTSDFDFFKSSANGFIFPPLGLFIFQAFAYILGFSAVTMRLTMALFSLINLSLIYLVAKEVYDCRTAMIAVALTSVSFYAFLASVQVDVEGSIIMFLYLLFAYCFVKLKESKVKWSLLGIIFGLALLVKSNTLLLAPILGLSLLLTSKDLIKSTIDTAKVSFIGVAIFSMFPLVSLLYVADISHVFAYGGRVLALNLSGLAPMMFLFWATPLLLGLAVLSILKLEKKDYFFISWIIVPFVFFSFFIIQRDFSRYFMILIPPLVILGSKFISTFRFKRKDLLACGVLTIIYFGVLLVLNAQPLKYVPRHMSSYISELNSLNFNFLFSYTTSSGPTFGVSFATIALTIFLSAALLLSFLFFRGKPIAKFIFIIFIAVNLAFNAFLVQEFVFHTQGPDPSQATYDLVDYFSEQELSYPVYTNDEGIMFYLDNSYWDVIQRPNGLIIPLPDNELDVDITSVLGRVKNEGGTVLLLNWPQIPKNSLVWNIVSGCDIVKTFSSEDYILGQVFTCGV